MNIEFKTEEEKSLTDFKHTIKTPTNFYILRFDFSKSLDFLVRFVIILYCID